MSEFERTYPEFPSGYDAWKTTDRYAEELAAAFDPDVDDDPDFDCDCEDCEDLGVTMGHSAVGPHAGWASQYDRDWDDEGDR